MRGLGIAAAVLFLLNDTALAYNNLQAATPILGSKIAGQLLVGKNSAQLADLVTKQFQLAKKISFTYQGQIFTVTPKELGLSINPSQTAQVLLQIGRTGNFWQKLLTQEKALLGLIDEPLPVTINPTLLTLKILEIQDKVEVDPLPQRPNFLADINQTLPATTGLKVDTAKLTKIIGATIDLPGEKSFPLPTKTVTVKKHYSESDLAPIRKQATKILSRPSVGLVAAGQSFILTPTDLRPMLVVAERPDPKDPKNSILVLRLNDKTLNNKLGDFANMVEAKNHAEFNFQYARVALYAQIFSGKTGPITISTFNVSAPLSHVLGVSTSANKTIYLTFDDGPDPTYHPLIVDILKNYGVKATFFLIGRNAQKYPDLVGKTLADGNSINNHSFTHAFLPNLSANSILEELKDTSRLLYPMNHNQPVRLFRPPYGGTNYYVEKDANFLGMREVLWSVDPRDWSEPETNDLVQRVVGNTVNGSIILMHSNHLATVRALPQILTSLKAKGFEFQLLTP